MLTSPHDYSSYKIFFFGDYDPFMTSFMKAHIPEGAVCWDVGSERGWFALLMGKLVGPTGRVDAFEAFLPNYEKLQANIALNNFTWVHSYNLAVGDRSENMYFIPPSDEITHHISFLEDHSGVGYLVPEARPGSIEVAMTTLDQHVEETESDRLDFIKMDIEGAEVAALQGAQQAIRQFRPKIAIEYNREAASRVGTSIEELDALLESYGYDRFTFWGRLTKLRLEEWENRPDIEVVFNVYCFPHK